MNSKLWGSGRPFTIHGLAERGDNAEQVVNLPLVGEDAVNAVAVQGGERWFVESRQFNPAVSGNVVLQQAQKAQLFGVEARMLLYEILKAVIHCCGL